MADRNGNRTRRWGPILWLGTVILALLAGYVASHWIVKQPAILTIPIREEICCEYVDQISEQLNAAAANPAVAAIILEIDSPGGDAGDSERLYFEVLQLREQKPVVAFIDGLGTSGAYFIACAAEPIYATGLSFVGNVGIRGPVYREPPPDEDYLVSGPYKLSAGSEEQQLQQFELISQRFLQAVLAQRGEQLGDNAALLPRGEAYYGVQALGLGLIDGIGTLADAREAAADQAGVRNYRTFPSQPSLLESVLSAIGLGGRSEPTGSARTEDQR
jgi:protease IV